jgi:hypothetical protein
MGNWKKKKTSKVLRVNTNKRVKIFLNGNNLTEQEKTWLKSFAIVSENEDINALG